MMTVTPSLRQASNPVRFVVVVAAYASALGMLLAWLVTALANRDTLLHLNYVSGAWVGLSHWANQGVYYPPLESQGYFGGTRFGPVAIALQALAHRICGDPIVGAKMLHLLYMLALIGGLWLLLRPLRLPNHIRALLVCLPLFTWIGWTAGLTIRHDSLAVLLQLWAVALLCRQRTASVWLVVLAACLTALAVLVKISALWGAGVCFIYLLWIAPRRLVLFVPAWLVIFAVGIGLAQWMSHGQFLANMQACLFAGEGAAGGLSFSRIAQSGYRLWLTLSVEPVLWLLLPMSVVGVWVGARRAPHIVLSTILIWLMSAYLWTRSGIDSNHLIDLVVIAVAGLGLSFSRTQSCETEVSSSSSSNTDAQILGRGRLAQGVVIALLVMCAFSLAVPQNWRGDWFQRVGLVAAAVNDVSGTEPLASAQQVVLRQLKPGEQVISFSPLVPVLLGEDPIVLDPWMLRLHFKNHPKSEAEFIERIEAHEFDAIVTKANRSDELKIAAWNFGPATIEAMGEHYVWVGTDAFSIFRPRDVSDEADAVGPETND